VDADRPTVLRALMETAALASRTLTDDLSRTAQRAVTRRVLAGAPVASPAWREIRSAIGSAPAVFVDAEEATALGAAHLAARAVTGVLPPPAAWRSDAGVAPERRREYERAFGGAVLR
jgi:xylulokinase